MIVLYNPRATEFKYRLPISVLSLAAVFEGKYRWQMVDGNVDADAENTLLRLFESDPSLRYLLVTVMPGPQLTRAVPHTRAIKERFPHVKVVWGGYFPSSHADACLRDPSIDFVVKSQGEHTIMELLEALEHGGDLATIDGLAYRDETGRIRHNKPRKLTDPNFFPPLPYDKVDVSRYLKNTILGSRTTSYHSSIGCPFTCSFCSVTKNYYGRWLAETASRTVHTILQLQDRYGVNGIEFHDSNFFTSEKRVAAFAEGIMGRGIGWWGEGTIDTIMRYDDKTWELMRDSGLKMIFMGAENASATTLKYMNKGPLTPETTLAMTEKSRRYGIIPEYSFVLGNPPDPEADIDENIEFIYKIKEINPASEIILYLYTPTPGGHMYEEAEKLGFRYPETLDEWVSPEWASFSRRRNPHTPWLREEHLRKLNDFETVLNARYPTVSDLKIRPWHRQILRTLGSWRYRTRVYRNPLELRAFFKYISYTQPEQAGL
jgi:anaerobic magnesium-protoporphyrin IX monomethyl ester cyclase